MSIRRIAVLACRTVRDAALDNALDARSKRRRAGFTLVELLVVIAIIALLSSSVMFAMYGMIEEARVDRTRAQIAKINDLIATRWESYRTRVVPLRIAPGTDPGVAARMRLAAIRELMRMELPDRITDVTDTPSLLYPNATNVYAGAPAQAVSISPPAVWRNYRRRAGYQWNLPATNTWPQSVLGGSSTWTPENQQAECLYMILATSHEGDESGLDFFAPSEIGDTDGDGMPEILDGWGRPIMWIRWPAGFVSDRQPASDPTFTQADAIGSGPDPFDPLRVDPRWTDADPAAGRRNDPFLQFPLIYSAGADGVYEIFAPGNDSSFHAVATTYGTYSDANSTTVTTPRNDPYYDPRVHNAASTFVPFGMPFDVTSDGSHADNLHNHLVEVK